MKVEKWLTVFVDGQESDSFRIELHVSLEDISNIMLDADKLNRGDAHLSILDGCNQLHRFLVAIPDELIEGLDERHREKIAESLASQSKRFANRSKSSEKEAVVGA